MRWNRRSIPADIALYPGEKALPSPSLPCRSLPITPYWRGIQARQYPMAPRRWATVPLALLTSPYFGVDRAPEPPLSSSANLGVPQTGAPANPLGATIVGSVLPLRRAEELIATLPGVLSVRIVPDATGAVDEVHVLTTDAVPPKATVRNIESAVLAHLGLRVNHRKISVATTLDAPRLSDRVVERGVSREPSSSDTAASASASATSAESTAAVHAVPVASRAPFEAAAHAVPTAPVVHTTPTVDVAQGRRVLLFEDVEVRRSRTKGVLCRVTIRRDDEHFVGEVEGQESERSRIELAARAALQAIGQAIATSGVRDRALALEGSKLIDAFDREFIFVSVTARLGRETVVLTGSSEVRDSAETSSVLAVLDATNRWIYLER